jgi:hypothetical protein
MAASAAGRAEVKRTVHFKSADRRTKIVGDLRTAKCRIGKELEKIGPVAEREAR